MAPLSCNAVTELLGVMATPVEERKRIRRPPRRLLEDFASVRKD
jgi:hypothetical protein